LERLQKSSITAEKRGLMRFRSQNLTLKSGYWRFLREEIFLENFFWKKFFHFGNFFIEKITLTNFQILEKTGMILQI